MAVLHFASPHWEKGRIFTSDSDFIFGVNTLALAVFEFKVKLLCYCLMDNHIHILLEGDELECKKCYKWIMIRLAQMAAKRGENTDRLDMLSIKPVMVTDRKQFVNEVAYILRNPYKARIASPSSYKWSSWGGYFNPWPDECSGELVGNMSSTRQRSLFHTRKLMPEHYEHLNGRILNKCFVDYRRTEKYLDNAMNLFDTLRLWDLESSVALAHGASEIIHFTDSELAKKLAAICRNEYHAESFQQLDRKSLLSLARTASRRFGAGKKQLARLLGIEPDVLDKVL